MHQHERHQLIVAQARGATRVDVIALAEAMDVTPETVRRDLTALERQGLVRRVHGGAVAIERLGFEPTVDRRGEHKQEEKRRIAEVAVRLAPEHGSILLDAGTTTMALAERLPVGRELTVVTNSLAIAGVLASRADLSLYVLGGRLRRRTLAAVGSWATAALRDIHVDVAFLGTNGLSLQRGLTTPDQAEADTKRAMLSVAQRGVVLTDHSKVGTAHFAKFADLSEIDTIVTDLGLDEETATDIEAQGPEVLRA